MSNMSKKIVITGGSGRFGNVLKKVKSNYNIFFPKKNELNILTNNIAKCYKNMMSRYEDIFKDIRETNNQTKSNSKTKFMDKTISYILIRDNHFIN